MKAAVLGSPIAHSLSPVLHQAAYRALGLTGWTYQAIECDEAALPGLLASCGPDWAGLSLTMPLKRAVLPLLDHIDASRRRGRRREHGRVRGRAPPRPQHRRARPARRPRRARHYRHLPPAPPRGPHPGRRRHRPLRPRRPARPRHHPRNRGRPRPRPRQRPAGHRRPPRPKDHAHPLRHPPRPPRPADIDRPRRRSRPLRATDSRSAPSCPPACSTSSTTPGPPP